MHGNKHQQSVVQPRVAVRVFTAGVALLRGTRCAVKASNKVRGVGKAMRGGKVRVKCARSFLDDDEKNVEAAAREDKIHPIDRLSRSQKEKTKREEKRISR